MQSQVTATMTKSRFAITDLELSSFGNHPHPCLAETAPHSKLTKHPCCSIGQAILHRKYSYRGLIYGWDATCMMGDEWKAAV